MAVSLAAVSWSDRRGGLLYQTDAQRYDGHAFRVTRVLDGDTLELDAPDAGRPTTRVRFWGIDAPEIPHPIPTGGVRPGEPFGAEATDFTRAAIGKAPVVLHLQPQRVRDGFGRLLAYVELPGGRTLNAELVEAGLARADGRWSHTQQGHFADLERAARQSGRGIWAKRPRGATSNAAGSAAAPPR